MPHPDANLEGFIASVERRAGIPPEQQWDRKSPRWEHVNWWEFSKVARGRGWYASEGRGGRTEWRNLGSDWIMWAHAKDDALHFSKRKGPTRLQTNAAKLAKASPLYRGMDESANPPRYTTPRDTALNARLAKAGKAYLSQGKYGETILVRPDGTTEGSASFRKPGKWAKDIPRAIRARDKANAALGESRRDTPMWDNVDESMKVTTGIRSAKFHRAIAKATGAVELRTEPNGEVWSKFGPPNRGYPIYVYPDGNEMMLGASHEMAYRDGTGGGVYIDVIDIKNRGGGLGHKVMAAIKAYADTKKAKVVVYKVTNAEFFAKFPWLTPKHGDFQYVPLDEAFAAHSVNRAGDPYPIYKNPTTRELRELYDAEESELWVGDARGIVDLRDESLYVFSARLLHQNARHALGMPVSPVQGPPYTVSLSLTVSKSGGITEAKVIASLCADKDMAKFKAVCATHMPGVTVLDDATNKPLGESFETFVKDTYYTKSDTPEPVYRNPTAKELRELGSGMQRGLVWVDADGADALAFRSNILHKVVRDTLSLSETYWHAVALRVARGKVTMVTFLDPRPAFTAEEERRLRERFPGADIYGYGDVGESADIIARINGLLEARYVIPSGRGELPVLKDTDVVRVFHGFRDSNDAISACRHGLSGKSRPARVYSYEADNNPTGLFVAANLRTSVGFGETIIEFNAKMSELEAPVWPGGGYTVQGEMSGTFGHGREGRANRQAARLKARREAKNSHTPAVAASDRPELARTLMAFGESNALFIGNLRPNRIIRVWVRDPAAENGVRSMTREEFLALHKSDTVDAGTEDDRKFAAKRLFGVDDRFDAEKFVAGIARSYASPKLRDKMNAEYIASVYARILERGVAELAYELRTYLWPKQIPAAIRWVRRQSRAATRSEAASESTP